MFVKVVFKGRSSPVDASDVDEVGAAVCRHIARYLTFAYHPHAVSVPDCSWEVRAQLGNQLRMIFRYTAVVGVNSLKNARNADLEVGTVVEESFLEGDVRDELINDLQNLSDENPLSETTSVELDTDDDSPEDSPAPTEQPGTCSLVPGFLQAVPVLGSVLNTVLCFFFGPEGMISNLFV